MASWSSSTCFVFVAQVWLCLRNARRLGTDNQNRVDDAGVWSLHVVTLNLFFSYPHLTSSPIVEGSVKSEGFLTPSVLVAVLQKGQKCVQLETALGMWHLLFSEDRSWQYLEDWVDFLQTHHAHRAISKDTWVQLFEFVKVGYGAEGWSTDGAGWLDLRGNKPAAGKLVGSVRLQPNSCTCIGKGLAEVNICRVCAWLQ